MEATVVYRGNIRVILGYTGSLNPQPLNPNRVILGHKAWPPSFDFSRQILQCWPSAFASSRKRAEKESLVIILV